VDARELLEQAYERWQRTGELPVDLMHPEVELYSGMAAGQPIYRGPEGWRSWQQELADVWDGLAVEVVSYVAVDRERAAAILRWRGVGKRSGVPVDQLDAQLITFRDGLAVRMDYYTNYRADSPPWA
jgi:ketosteroid isomerase-like protein